MLVSFPQKGHGFNSSPAGTSFSSHERHAQRSAKRSSVSMVQNVLRFSMNALAFSSGVLYFSEFFKEITSLSIIVAPALFYCYAAAMWAFDATGLRKSGMFFDF